MTLLCAIEVPLPETRGLGLCFAHLQNNTYNLCLAVKAPEHSLGIKNVKIFSDQKI